MYKYLSILLFSMLLILGGFFTFEKYSHRKDNSNLNNQIAQLQKTVKESEDSYSRLAVESKNIKAENSDLQKKIKARDEQIVALTEIAIKLKDEIMKITNATQTTNVDGNIKVDFVKDNGLLKISGYTLTGNPPYAEVKLEWLRALKMQLILVRDSNKQFRVYLDGKNSDVESAELNLKIDNSVLARSWYEKIVIGTDVGVGNDGIINAYRAYYELFGSWLVGPFVQFEYDGKLQKFYGGSVLWRPFGG